MANKYGLILDLEKKNPSLMYLFVDLYESVVPLNSGEDEWQFAITITLRNEGYDTRLNGSKPNLPIVISSITGYTFRDTVDSKNSIYATTISSPKQRALELMKEPYRFRLEQVINDGLQFYVNKWYGGVLPNELKNVHLFTRDNIPDSQLEQSGRKFVPLNKFKKLI